MNVPLGRLRSVSPREVWKHEAHDFTRWMAEPENIELLADAIGAIEIEVEQVEKAIGRFTADIVARDQDDNLVLIENQLEPSDHRHLGQLVTYLAGLNKDAAVVWVCTEFRAEHLSAIKWLNENTGDQFKFFGLEIELFRIGDSAPAPRFNVGAAPDEHARQNRQAAVQALSGRDQFYIKYWSSYMEWCTSHGRGYARPSPPSGHTYGVPTGRSNITFNLKAAFRDGWCGVDLYLGMSNATELFDLVHADREQIDPLITGNVEWLRMPDKKASVVQVMNYDLDPNDEAGWSAQFAWMTDRLEELQHALRDRAVQYDMRLAAGSAGDDE